MEGGWVSVAMFGFPAEAMLLRPQRLHKVRLVTKSHGERAAKGMRGGRTNGNWRSCNHAQYKEWHLREEGPFDGSRR